MEWPAPAIPTAVDGAEMRGASLPHHRRHGCTAMQTAFVCNSSKSLDGRRGQSSQSNWNTWYPKAKLQTCFGFDYQGFNRDLTSSRIMPTIILCRLWTICSTSNFEVTFSSLWKVLETIHHGANWNRYGISLAEILVGAEWELGTQMVLCHLMELRSKQP